MKRFWKEATIEEASGGWAIRLDGRPVRTPAKREVVVPSRSMAARIAAEWDAQVERVNPLEMPMTRTAATCLDRVAPEILAVRDMIAAYGETDLICYRAEQPDDLAARQSAGWDPLIDWAAVTLGARLSLGAGVMHVAQPAEALEAFRAALAGADPWRLTALAELTTLSGSLVIALAVERRRLGAAEAWALSRIDEQWNIDQWGEDAEAAAQAARREADFMHAADVLAHLVGDARD